MLDKQTCYLLFIWGGLALIVGLGLTSVNIALGALVFVIGVIMMLVGLVEWGGAEKVEKDKKRRIADFAIPVLKSKGEVSIYEIATTLGMDVVEVKRLVDGSGDAVSMLTEGWLEDVYLEGGVLRSPARFPKAPPAVPSAERPTLLGEEAAEKVIIKETKEIVKAPCKYCGTLVPVESQKCPECGARLR